MANSILMLLSKKKWLVDRNDLPQDIILEDGTVINVDAQVAELVHESVRRALLLADAIIEKKYWHSS
jgi:hypothetical protein